MACFCFDFDYVGNLALTTSKETVYAEGVVPLLELATEHGIVITKFALRGPSGNMNFCAAAGSREQAKKFLAALYNGADYAAMRAEEMVETAALFQNQYRHGWVLWFR